MAHYPCLNARIVFKVHLTNMHITTLPVPVPLIAAIDATAAGTTDTFDVAGSTG